MSCHPLCDSVSPLPRPWVPSPPLCLRAGSIDRCPHERGLAGQRNSSQTAASGSAPHVHCVSPPICFCHHSLKNKVCHSALWVLDRRVCGYCNGSVVPSRLLPRQNMNVQADREASPPSYLPSVAVAGWLLPVSPLPYCRCHFGPFCVSFLGSLYFVRSGQALFPDLALEPSP